MPTFPLDEHFLKQLFFDVSFFFFSDSCPLHQHHPRLSTSFSNIFFSSSPQSTFEHRAFKRHHVFARTPTRRGGTSACPAPSICSGESFVHLPLKHTTVSSSCLGNSMKRSTVRGSLFPPSDRNALISSRPHR